VTHWRADGSARVHYRGADWDARFVGAGQAEPGEHVVHAVDGSCLMLERKTP
jgi:membrane protein implicated in regulation of membrane protease activity